MPDELKSHVRVVYFPQLGFLILIPPNEYFHQQNHLDGLGWIVKFQTEDGIYLKNGIMNRNPIRLFHDNISFR